MRIVIVDMSGRTNDNKNIKNVQFLKRHILKNIRSVMHMRAITNFKTL